MHFLQINKNKITNNQYIDNSNVNLYILFKIIFLNLYFSGLLK